MEKGKEGKKQMTKAEYGDKFNDHLLEQYKLFVETADTVTGRRAQANQFFISVLSALLAILSFAVGQESFSNILDVILVAVALLGIVLCAIWYATINSYKQLNKLKFTVIHEMEAMLPFACYDREWEIEKETKSKYIRLTKVEKYVPFIMTIPYFLLLLYAFYRLLK